MMQVEALSLILILQRVLEKLSKRKWAIPGKQDWRYGMNQSGIYGAKILVNLDTTKGVIAYWQQERGHGSRYRLRSV